MRIRVLVVLSLLMAAVVAIGPSPAAAAGGSIWSHRGVLYDTCRDHSYGYTVNPGSSEWSLEVTLLAPDGTTEGHDYLYDAADPRSGTSHFQFCGWEMPGRYKIRATLTWYDDDFNEYESTLPAAYFWMRKPYTRTALTTSDRTPHFNEVVRFRAKVRDERPAGYFATRYAAVVLQVRTATGWRVIRGSRTTTDQWGTAVWRYRWNIGGTTKLRARTLRSPDFQPSNSAVVKVVTTRNGRPAG